MSTSINFFAAGLAMLGACSVEIPSGKITCDERATCPPDFACVESLCVRGGVPARPPVGEPDASDETDAREEPDACDPLTECKSDAQAPVDCSDDASCADAGDICVPEQCNGLDDDCDGRSDEGVLSLNLLATVDQGGQPYDLRILPLADGNLLVLDSSVSLDETRVQTISASLLAPDGQLLNGPTALARGPNARFAAALIDNGFALLHVTSSYTISVFSLDDLSLVFPSRLLDAQPRTTATLDLARSDDALGERLWILHDQAGAITVSSFRPRADESVQDEFVVQSPSEMAQVVEDARLATAPCSRGLVVLLRRLLPRSEVRVLGFSMAGLPTGLDLQLAEPSEGAVLSFADPLLSPGDCSRAPDTLYTGLGMIEDIDDEQSAPSLVVAAYDLTAAALGSVRFRETIPLDAPIFPDGFLDRIGASSALALRADGTLFAAASTIDTSSATGDIVAYEVDDQGEVARLPVSVAPRLPSAVELVSVDAEPPGVLLGASGWLDQGPAVVNALGCGEP